MDYDFSGLATAYEIECDDQRYIESGAFDHQDGQIVPLVWRHGHDDIRNILGHSQLIVNDVPPGIRAKCVFNDTTEGRKAKILVENGDIDSLSIYANELTEQRDHSKTRVKHGTIREVSLVLTGMNPGARIDEVLRHSDDPLDPEMIEIAGIIIHSGSSYPLDIGKELRVSKEKEEEKTIVHEESKTLRNVLDSLTEDQMALFGAIIHSAVTGEKPPTGDEESNSDGPTLEDIYNDLSKEQKTVLHYMVGELGQDVVISQGDTEAMPNKHNIFEKNDNGDTTPRLSHEQMVDFLKGARESRVMSLRDYALAHSITDIDYMFPDAKMVDGPGPMYYTRPIDWVEGVIGGTRTRPFSRIKSMYADLTPDAARAKGYVTGAQKVEEVIAVLKRVTTPQTVYKLQKLDRDDIIDITDFDVVVWLKEEMRLMLREEIARAVLIGDGRASNDADKIVETNVRPIYNDDPVYTIDAIFNDPGNEQALSAFSPTEVLDLIDFIADARKAYRGAGSPTFYTQPEVLTKLLLVRDTTGRRIFDSEAQLASALRVSSIVEIPPMSGLTRTGHVNPPGLPTGTYNIDTLGVIVNLKDYVIGADRGGQTSFFDDFDIDYNQYKYLYETRLSGALVVPQSAISVELVIAKTA